MLHKYSLHYGRGPLFVLLSGVWASSSEQFAGWHHVYRQSASLSSSSQTLLFLHVDSRRRLRSASTAALIVPRSKEAQRSAAWFATELFPLPRRKYGTPYRRHCRPSNGDWKLNFLSAVIQCPIIIALWFCASLRCYVTLIWSFFALRHDSCLSFVLTYLHSHHAGTVQ